MAVEFILLILKIFILTFLVLLPFLYDLSPPFRYYFKFFVYYWLFAFVNLVLAPIITWTWAPIGIPNVSIFSFLHRAISYILNIQWTVIGEETLALNQPCIIVVNQQSPVDILGVFSAFSARQKDTIIQLQRHRDCFADFARLASIFNPILTYTSQDWNTVVYSTIIERVKRKKAIVWIFCERLEELESDIFHLALKEHIPVIPLLFTNYYFINNCDKIFDPGRVTVKILPPLSQNEDGSTDSLSQGVENMKITMKYELKTLSEKAWLKISSLMSNTIKLLTYEKFYEGIETDEYKHLFLGPKYSLYTNRNKDIRASKLGKKTQRMSVMDRV